MISHIAVLNLTSLRFICCHGHKYVIFSSVFAVSEIQTKFICLDMSRTSICFAIDWAWNRDSRSPPD